MKVLKIKNWKTVDYPEKQYKSASITKTVYKEGYYLMEGVDGYDLFQVLKPITVTELRINNNIVMVDDPLHWIGMQRLAEACRGKVLIGGLGLGLILHHLKNNKEVSQIDVVEINKDVIQLIKPLLPKDDRVKIYCADVLKWIWLHRFYDTVVLDLWVKDFESINIAGFNYNLNWLDVYMKVRKYMPQAEVYIWGIRNSNINPAYKGVSEEYLIMLDIMRRERNRNG